MHAGSRAHTGARAQSTRGSRQAESSTEGPPGVPHGHTRAPDTAPQVVRQRDLTSASPAKPTSASPAKIIKPSVKPPVNPFDQPSAFARKKPPTPPAAPTRPVIT